MRSNPRPNYPPMPETYEDGAGHGRTQSQAGQEQHQPLEGPPPLSPSCENRSNSSMAEGDPVRIIPHRGVDDDSGSLEVWFADGRKSIRFYWDNLVSRRLSPNTLTREQAIEKTTALARAEMDKMDNPE